MRHAASCGHSLRNQRRAVVTVMVLIVLILISGLMAQFVRQVIADRRQMRMELQHRQALQLAEAGIQRLGLQRTANAEYSGETWGIPAGTVHQTNSARVVISVREDAASIVVHYPANTEIPFQVTRTVRLSK